ncbi:MAG TPA: type II toxin-antitoxin system Phd/YefM family antitoxin, partial [Clostridia bacterium]|nr:type II toxin-antitoxin system Phd/YefM family antitoxin [Clostridia bacterium]
YMTIDTKQIVTITEANQNFSRVTRIADKNGHVIILKNNKPKYILYDLDKNPIIDLTDDERIDIAAARILKKYLPALKKLAK